MGIPERLVEIREKNGYTRKKLADELGRPYRTITKYETGEREPGHSYIVEIAKKFGVSTDYILGASDLMVTDTQKSPSTAEAVPGDEDILSIFNYLNEGLVSLGFIDADSDITEQQADVLISICRILRTAFKKPQ